MIKSYDFGLIIIVLVSNLDRLESWTVKMRLKFWVEFL